MRNTKMTTRKQRLLELGLPVSVGMAFLMSLGGCLSTGSVEESEEDSKMPPLVDMVIHYMGPNPIWAGPHDFTLKVTTRRPGIAQVFILPPPSHTQLAAKRAEVKHEEKGGVQAKVEEAKPGDTQPTNAPKPSEASEEKSAGDQTLSIESVRRDLRRLDVAMNAHPQEFRGCLSPVKVILIRADATSVERLGCREDSGWPQVASELVSRYIEATQEKYREAARNK